MVWDSLIHGQEKRCPEWLFLTMMKILYTVRNYHCTFVFVKLRLTRVDLNLFCGSLFCCLSLFFQHFQFSILEHFICTEITHQFTSYFYTHKE